MLGGIQIHKSSILIFLGILTISFAAVRAAGTWYYGNTITHQGITYQVTLTDDAPYQVPIGTQINFTATLFLGPNPVSDAWLYLQVNGTMYSTAPTNQTGQALFTFIMPTNDTFLFTPAYEDP